MRTAAKGFAVPIFSVKTSSPDHLTRAVQTILGLEPSPGGLFGASRTSDADPSADLDHNTLQGIMPGLCSTIQHHAGYTRAAF